MSKTIMGVQLLDRMQNASDFQSLLSKYGCYIETRIGLHSTNPKECSPSGIILLNFADGADHEISEFEDKLKDFGDVVVQKMVF
jgi:hypothetical protein